MVGETLFAIPRASRRPVRLAFVVDEAEDVFVVLYQWKVEESREEQFREGWRLIVKAIYENYGSLGARLHKSDKNLWVAYSQWRNREEWERAWKAGPADCPEGYEMMQESLDPDFHQNNPLAAMTVTDDLLVHVMRR